MMDERIPEPIRPFLQDYIRLLEQQLGDLLEACYLYGSIALGAFNERMSDIDFITVLSRSPTSSDIVQLQAIHQNLQIAYPRWTLDGSYLQWHDFGCLPDAVIPYPYVAQGIFHAQGYRDLNLVTWWVLKHHGIAIVGSSPQTLPFTVSWDELIARMYENLNSYWLNWTRSPTRLAQLFTDYGIQWAVLGILRLWYAFRENAICFGSSACAIASKTQAGRYALAHLSNRWHLLIQEAINLRDHPEHRLYTCRIHRGYDAVKFLHYMIRLCNEQALCSP